MRSQSLNKLDPKQNYLPSHVEDLTTIAAFWSIDALPWSITQLSHKVRDVMNNVELENMHLHST